MNRLRAATEAQRQAAIASSDETKANALRVLQSYLTCVRAFADAWKALSAGRHGEAWGDLVTVEEKCKLLARYLDLSAWGLDFLDRHTGKIMRLFPHKIFNSIEYVATKRECSVCGKDPYLSDCPHIPGELHMGEFVHCTISDMVMLGMSLTDNPLDKRCVMISVQGEPTDNANSMLGVKALADRALGPLHGFTIDESPRLVSPREYHHEGVASKCRCRSGKRFGNCCWRRPTMKIPWTHIEMDKPAEGAVRRIAPAVWVTPVLAMVGGAEQVGEPTAS